MTARLRTCLTTTLALFLASCTTPAPRPVPPPTPLPPPASTARPSPAPVIPVTPAPRRDRQSVQAPDTWALLRESFAMHDCPAPALRQARLETRNRQEFETHMHDLLPVIDYIRRVAEARNVAGEFALLPWVESHFRDIPPRRGRPAGMWQIMPITARSLGLPVTRTYDGRLDKIAASEAALQLMSDYHDHWKDWRVADMAYNTGEYRMRRIIKTHGMPAASPAIPDLPVGRVTRRHLTRLLAIACIVRDPARFNVTLPKMDAQRQLEVVQLAGPARIERIAHLSGISTSALRKLNPGYRLGTISTATPMRVLLPAPAAHALNLAMANDALEDSGDLASLESTAAGGSYTVTAGDSLWGIARRFDLDIEKLRAWNNLKNSTLQPGQILKLEPAPSS